MSPSKARTPAQPARDDGSDRRQRILDAGGGLAVDEPDVRDRRVLREQPLCQEALRYGRREPATVAHHVYPVDDFPGWRFCRWNLIAVSADAHNSFHDRVTGKLTERGLAWQRRVSPPRNAPPPF